MKNYYTVLKKHVPNVASRHKPKYNDVKRLKTDDTIVGSENKTLRTQGTIEPYTILDESNHSVTSSENSSCSISDHSQDGPAGIVIYGSGSSNMSNRDSPENGDILWNNFKRAVISHPMNKENLNSNNLPHESAFNPYFDEILSNLREKQNEDSNNLKKIYTESKSESVISNGSSGNIYSVITTQNRTEKPEISVTKDISSASTMINYELNPTKMSISKIIQDMSDHKDNVEVQKFGCRSLKCLATQSVTNKRKIMLRGGVPAIVSVIENHPNDLALAALAFSTLCSLTSHDSSNKHEISKTHLVQHLLSTMKQYFNNEDIQKEGCMTLLNLTFCPSHLLQLKDTITTTIDPRPILCDASHRFPEKCRNSCSITLKRLNPNENDIIDMIQFFDSDVEDVTLLMNAYMASPTIQEMACVKLDILSKIPNSDSNDDAVAASLILPPLFAAMKEYKDRASLQLLACSILNNLYQNEYDSRENINMNAILTSEAIDLVVDAMERFKSDSIVQEKGRAFLCFLLKCTDASTVALIRQKLQVKVDCGSCLQ